MSPPARISLVLAALLSTPLASAAEIATVVVYDPAGDDRSTGEEVAREAWLQQFGTDASVRFVSVETILSGSEPVVLLGQALVEVCDGARSDAAAFTAAADAVVERVEMMEYLEAAGALARAEAMLPCLSEAPSPEALGRHHFLRGIVAFYADGPQAAVDRFEEGLLASPFLQWNGRFPPPIKPSFAEAVSSALQAGTAFLSLSPTVTSGGRLWLDGLEVDPRTRTTTLFEGTHLMQWEPTGGALRSWSVSVGAGESVDLVHRDDAVGELLAGRASAVVTSYARERVLSPVEREAGGRMLVAEPWEVTLFHEFDADGQRWWLADLDAIEDWRASGRRMRGVGIGLGVVGLVSVVVGGALTLDGAVQAVDAHEAIYGTDGIGTRGAFETYAPGYEKGRVQAGVGIGITIGGGVMVGVSVPLAIEGEKRHRATGLHRTPAPKPAEDAPQGADEAPEPPPEPEAQNTVGGVSASAASLSVAW